MLDPDPSDYDVWRDEYPPRVIAEYPNMKKVTRVKIPDDGSIYTNIEEQRRSYDMDYDSCPNCDESLTLSLAEAQACNDCWGAALDAIEEWADSNAADLLSEWASSGE